MLRKIQFISSISVIYFVTLGTIAYLLQSSHLLGASAQADMAPIIRQTLNTDDPTVISGKPIRITIDGAGIDLPLIDGYYDASNDSWTLSNDKAQFAVMSTLANNKAGTTFIYGHGTDAVFGKIGERHPAAGTIATVTTDSGHTFRYKLVDVHDYTPNDTSLLTDTTIGKPQLVVQTCTGTFSQWRTMFVFDYQGVN